MRIGTLFSGIGSPEQGASRVHKDLDLVFACEWDKYARESFNANYSIPEEHFHKDITDMDGTQYKDKVDIIIGGSPCQDFSIAGLRAGVEGNKGVLIYEYIRIIQEVSPEIFIYENVKGMLSDKGGRTIKEFVEAFREMGYYCHYEVLNTKDYGVPQNRERIFLVGFKSDEHYHNFSYTPKQKLTTRLKDLLEDGVDSKYYLKNNADFAMDINSIGRTLRVGGGSSTSEKHCFDVIKVPSATSRGYEEAIEGDSINLTHPRSTTRRGRVGKGVAQTLDCACNQAVVEDILNPLKGKTKFGWHFEQNVYSEESICTRTIMAGEGSGSRAKVIEKLVSKDIKESVRKNFVRDYQKIITSKKTVWYSDCDSGFQDNKVCLTESACLRANNDNLFTLDNAFKIRKLTPRECFRLQDFPDDFKFVVSNSQLYKQAGNSISANVMEMIFNQIEKSKEVNTNIGSLF